MANESERRIMVAIREADTAFEKAGESGTKAWLRDFFGPALKRHGLRIIDEHGTELAPAGILGRDVNS